MRRDVILQQQSYIHLLLTYSAYVYWWCLVGFILKHVYNICMNYCSFPGKVRRKSLGHNWKTLLILGTVKNQEKLLPNKLLKSAMQFPRLNLPWQSRLWWCDNRVSKIIIREVHSLFGVAFVRKRFAIISSLCHFPCVFCFVLSHFSTMVSNTFYLFYFKCSWHQ